jgi:hypothetical protein
MIDIKNSQEVNQLMQPYNFKIQLITSLYHFVRDQSANASLTSNINCDGTHKQTEGRSVDVALFAEELIGIYNTPTPRVFGVLPKSCVVLIDWCRTITGA